MVVAMIGVDAYPFFFLAFSGLTCHLEDTGKGTGIA